MDVRNVWTLYLAAALALSVPWSAHGQSSAEHGALQELRAMQRALGAALRGAGEGQDRATPFPRRGRNSVESYYLPGQGALFVSKRVDRSRYSRSSSVSALEKELARLDPVDEEVLQAARESMDDPEGLSHVSGLLGVPTSQATSSAPETPGSSAPQQTEGDAAAVGGQQAQTGVDLRQLELAKRRIALEREIVKRREAEAGRTVEAREQLEQSVRRVVEVLSTHGDMLSMVGPAEHVTVVLRGPPFSEKGHTTRVLFVLRSVISSFKAGHLTSEEFEQRVQRSDQ